MTLGEVLLSELDSRGIYKHWKYEKRQYLRGVDSAELLADFLKSCGLEKVRVSDDAVQVADGICAAMGVKACKYFTRRGLIDLVLAAIIFITAFRRGGDILTVALASVLGVVFFLLGVLKFTMVRRVKREMRKSSVPLT